MKGDFVGASSEFTAEVEWRTGVARVALGGELDMMTVPILAEQLERSEQDGIVALVLDLRNLTFVDSSGLHAFLRARKRAEANGHRLLLIGATQETRRLFELTGTEYLMDGQEAVPVLDQFTASPSPSFDPGLPDDEADV
jgi:anti-sigma B factor antagonist